MSKKKLAVMQKITKLRAEAESAKLTKIKRQSDVLNDKLEASRDKEKSIVEQLTQHQGDLLELMQLRSVSGEFMKKELERRKSIEQRVSELQSEYVEQKGRTHAKLKKDMLANTLAKQTNHRITDNEKKDFVRLADDVYINKFRK